MQSLVLFFMWIMNYTGISDVLCWNCRGISNSNTRNRFWEFVNKHRPQIICLIETKADVDRCHHFCKRLSKDWNWAALLAQGMPGGLMIFWKNGLGPYHPLALSHNIIHLVISSTPLDGWILSIVYNSQVLSGQVKVWEELSKLSKLWVPWLMVGDYNVIRSEAEHRGGNFKHYTTKSTYFNAFIAFNSLMDLGFSGPLILGVMGSWFVPSAGIDSIDFLLIWIGSGFLMLIRCSTFIVLLLIILLYCLMLACILVLIRKFFVLKFFGWSIRVVMMRLLKLGVLILGLPLSTPSPS